MGRWSARHRKIAILGWFAFVIAAFALGTLSGTKQIDPDTAGVGESGPADRILDAGFQQPAAESGLIESETPPTTDPAFTAPSEGGAARGSAPESGAKVRAPPAPGNEG